MVAWLPLARTAMKVAPIALEVGRQLDRQLRPHILAYRFARDVDGWVGRWTGTKTHHWVVFARPDAPPLRAFPPLPDADVDVVHAEIDRAALQHHSELPEAKLKERTNAVVTAPTRAVGKLRRGDDGHRPT